MRIQRFNWTCFSWSVFFFCQEIITLIFSERFSSFYPDRISLKGDTFAGSPPCWSGLKSRANSESESDNENDHKVKFMMRINMKVKVIMTISMKVKVIMTKSMKVKVITIEDEYKSKGDSY